MKVSRNSWQIMAVLGRNDESKHFSMRELVHPGESHLSLEFGTVAAADDVISRYHCFFRACATSKLLLSITTDS